MPNKQIEQGAAATATTITNDEEREYWALLRACHEEALDRVLKDDYEGFSCETKPGKDAPLIEKIDYFSFVLFCEGFLKGMSLLPGKPNA